MSAPTVSVAGTILTLLPAPAAWWQDEATLFVADTHFGKAATFRAAGVPVPAGTTRANLDRLDETLAATGARRLVVLGDLLHAKTGRAPGTLAAVAAWRERHAHLEILLVRGNHDRRAGAPPDDWRITSVDPPAALGPFTLRHEPAPEPDPRYTLAGHVHPSVRLFAASGESLRAPCFVFGETAAILPAFGAFTGTARVRPRAGDRVFVVGPEAVVRVG